MIKETPRNNREILLKYKGNNNEFHRKHKGSIK